MSQINTNGINVNYPVPGENNNSQGFRDNFAQIRTNLNTASTEITDLQTKAVLKAALTDSVLNNDMANTLISNASVRSFRATTYNMGNSLSGTVLVDVSRGDVQYGAITGNVTLQFGGWAPTNTQSNVTLRLTMANTLASVAWPNACLSTNNNYGVDLLENVQIIGNIAYTTSPANTTILQYSLTSLDCGDSISVIPINRPFDSTQIITRDVPSTGLPGDLNGAVAVSPSVNQLVITGANTDPYLTTSGNTTQLYTDMPVVFTGTSLAGNIVVGTTYYVRNVVSTTTFTVSSTIGGANIVIGANASGTTMLANPASYLYICTDAYNATAVNLDVTQANTTGNILVAVTNNIVVNAPIIFGGNLDTANTNLVANTVYYVKTIDSPTGTANIIVSKSRTNQETQTQ